jgi:hypothetical protein
MFHPHLVSPNQSHVILTPRMIKILVHVVAHPTPTPPHVEENEPPLPKSSIPMYELAFSTVAGICAGAIVKNGAKTVASLVEGIFVFLHVCYILTILWLYVDED